MSKPALLGQREEGAGGAHTLGGLSETPLTAIPTHILRAVLCPLLPVMQCQRQESCAWGREVRRWVKDYCFQRIAAREKRCRVQVTLPSCCWFSSALKFECLELPAVFQDYNLWTPIFTETTQWLFAFPTPLVSSSFFGSFESGESTSSLFSFLRLEINQKLT